MPSSLRRAIESGTWRPPGVRPVAFLAAVVVATLCTSSMAAEQAAPRPSEVLELQRQARAKMRSIDYELAIPLLERALTGGLSQTQRAELEADLGICHANLGDTEHARAALQRALTANALLDLPVGTSPKIRKLFDELRLEGAQRTAQPTTVVVSASEPVGTLVRPVDFIMGGAVVAGAVAGILAGVVSSNAASELQSGLHDRATVDSLSSRQRAFGVASVCAYGVAGAAAVTELALILFLNRRPDAAPLSVGAAIAPTGGATATLQVRF